MHCCDQCTVRWFRRQPTRWRRHCEAFSLEKEESSCTCTQHEGNKSDHKHHHQRGTRRSCARRWAKCSGISSQVAEVRVFLPSAGAAGTQGPHEVAWPQHREGKVWGHKGALICKSLKLKYPEALGLKSLKMIFAFSNSDGNSFIHNFEIKYVFW